MEKMNNTEKKQDFKKPELSVRELTNALYEATKTLNETNQRLLKEQKEKEEIFANISHDLRSPITVISNSIEYLLSFEELDPDVLKQSLLLMKTKSEYLKRLIEDVFLLSSLECNLKELHREELPIIQYLEEYYYGIEADPTYADRALSIQLPADYESIVSIDPKLFERVLDNLFSNALKFSFQGDSIRLRASINKDASYCIIQVSNTGIGISPNDLPYIFNRTYKADAARSPGADKGCGLGLAIAQSILKQQEGTIQCESQGKETAFTITLPLLAKHNTLI